MPKHVPLRDISAAAHIRVVGAFITLTWGLPTVDAFVV
jgi:hypothetical protein